MLTPSIEEMIYETISTKYLAPFAGPGSVTWSVTDPAVYSSPQVRAFSRLSSVNM